MLKITKLTSAVLVAGLAAACTTSGEVSPPLQFAAVETIQVFDKNRTSYSQKAALIDGGFITDANDLDPYVSR